MKVLGHMLAAVLSAFGAIYFLMLATQAATGIATNPMTGELQRSSPETGVMICLVMAGLCGVSVLINLALAGGGNE